MVIVFSGESSEGSVERYEGGAGLSCECEQKAVTDPLGCALRGEGRGGLSKSNIEVTWLGMEVHARVVEPMIVDRPSTLKGECILTHDRVIDEQAQQTQLSVTAEKKSGVSR